jgi:G3E family GTPase
VNRMLAMWNRYSTFLSQIAGSDVILLNKADLVTPAALSQTEELIRLVNSAAPLYRTVRADIDLGLIMGISAYASPPQIQSHVAVTAASHEHCEDHDIHNHSREPTHYELRGISNLHVSCPILSRASFDRLDEWIRSVLWENHIPGASENQDLQILRCKGLVSMESGEQYVLQGVRSLYEMVKVDHQIDMGVPEPGKIVLIGKGLNDSVRQSLEDTLAR